ncbi:MAG: hypothetical protein WCE83_14305 [Candidatus Baltobacteraceae bacterium]
MIRPIWFTVETPSSNQRAPSGPDAMNDGSLCAVGTGYSVIAPLVVIRPMLFPVLSPNQSAPSGPAAIPSGALFAVGTGNSVTAAERQMPKGADGGAARGEGDGEGEGEGEAEAADDAAADGDEAGTEAELPPDELQLAMKAEAASRKPPDKANVPCRRLRADRSAITTPMRENAQTKVGNPERMRRTFRRGTADTCAAERLDDKEVLTKRIGLTIFLGTPIYAQRTRLARPSDVSVGPPASAVRSALRRR